MTLFLLNLFLLLVCLLCVNKMDKDVELAKEIGLSDEDLMDFVKERERAARDDKAHFMELYRKERSILTVNRNFETIFFDIIFILKP